MAIPRPQAVAISASAIPPVTACTASSSFPRKLNERISPVIVPNRPSNGASVTRVSITTRYRLKNQWAVPEQLMQPEEDSLQRRQRDLLRRRLPDSSLRQVLQVALQL